MLHGQESMWKAVCFFPSCSFTWLFIEHFSLYILPLISLTLSLATDSLKKLNQVAWMKIYSEVSQY